MGRIKGKRPDAHHAEAQGMQGMKKYKTIRESDLFYSRKNRKMLATVFVEKQSLRIQIF